jgi:hypothetical protein
MPTITPMQGDPIEAACVNDGHPPLPARLESKTSDGRWEISLKSAPSFRSTVRMEAYEWTGKAWAAKTMAQKAVARRDADIVTNKLVEKVPVSTEDGLGL